MEEPGFAIDRYQVIGRLGAGANGQVYLANDPKLDRQVAIKVVHPDLAADPEVMVRFHREARAIAKLHHPNILELYDYSGADSALAFLVVERLIGRNLEELVQENGPLDAGTAAAATYEICLALQHAHDLGIVHRDLKPENVFLEPSGRIVLCDFGIARSFDKRERGTLAGSDTNMMGTPLFMSPEQIMTPGELGSASDLFSLGSVLYYLVSGEFSFGADSIVAVLQKIVVADYKPIAGECAEIIDRCLRVNSEDRYASARELGKALLGVLKASGFSDPRAALSGIATPVSVVARAAQPIDRNDEMSRTIFRSAAQSPARPLPEPKPKRSWPAVAAAVAALVVVALLFARKSEPPAEVQRIVLDMPDLPPPQLPVELPALAPPIATTPDRPKPQQPAKTPEPSKRAAPTPEPTLGPGSVRIVAVPWADVFIDDRKVGTTPIFRTTPLPAGKHTLRLVNPGFTEIVKHFDIVAGEALDMKFDLSKGVR